MKKPITSFVNVASLKAQLAKYLRMVKSGREVIVTDRRQPVARLIPFEPLGSLETLKPEGSFSEVASLRGGTLKKNFDSLPYLLEERGKR